MVKKFGDALMSAEVDAICGDAYGQRSDECTNHRNGYRLRDWDTRAGTTVELAIPKLRQGSYFPDWLVQYRRRAEQALVSVVAPATCWGCRRGGWRSWSSSWASSSCRSRRSPRWPRLTIKVREAGRTVQCVRPDRGRSERRPAAGSPWVGGGLAGGRGRLVGVPAVVDGPRSRWGGLVISDAHRGLVDAIAAALPGAAWQRSTRTT
jgi:putative transposase